MQAFVSEYEEKLNELCDKCKQIKQIYNKVLVSKLVKVTWAIRTPARTVRECESAREQVVWVKKKKGVNETLSNRPRE